MDGHGVVAAMGLLLVGGDVDDDDDDIDDIDDDAVGQSINHTNRCPPSISWLSSQQRSRKREELIQLHLSILFYSTPSHAFITVQVQTLHDIRALTSLLSQPSPQRIVIPTPRIAATLLPHTTDRTIRRALSPPPLHPVSILSRRARNPHITQQPRFTFTGVRDGIQTGSRSWVEIRGFGVWANVGTATGGGWWWGIGCAMRTVAWAAGVLVDAQSGVDG